MHTMKSFTLITALLLCSLSWISDSVSESQTVEVQSGEEVTLLCSNISRTPTQTDWFRLINRTKPSCISSMFQSDGNASFCHGFQNGRFEMSSNVSTVFLKIKKVDLSDSGLYFCGFYVKTHTVIASATHLNVPGKIVVKQQETNMSQMSLSPSFSKKGIGDSDDEVDFKTKKELDGITNLMSVILVGLTVFLTIVVIVLAVKIRKLQTAENEELQPEENKNLGSDDLNYAALSFQAKLNKPRRPASQRELEPNVVYAATR
ncbi:uncharacterized protein LOC119911894 [Micropterus salmoides]|uniref:uncharacterized protein LOC119911894 n=1 Tax=Micropterus salmoides TaxID=27706 RepID=UPI0018ED1040|nr:uncharacterized protein LOC119911894 [Micropterus salmoides]